MKFTTLTHLTLLVAALATAQIASAATILLVEEKFDGDNTSLAGKTADTFDSGIIAAGGSETWSTGTSVFKRDGSVVGDGTGDRSIHLNLGSYINDTKGEANGLFVLSVTISETTGTWLSVGFSEQNNPIATNDFRNVGGIGTMAYRGSGAIAGWAGPGTGGSTGDTAAQLGNQKLTITLDLRNHNGTDNFGTVSFHASGPGDVFGTGTGWSGSTYSYSSNVNFGSILLSRNSSTTGTYSDLTLSQIPEPGVALLGGLGLLMLLLRRRR